MVAGAAPGIPAKAHTLQPGAMQTRRQRPHHAQRQIMRRAGDWSWGPRGPLHPALLGDGCGLDAELSQGAQAWAQASLQWSHHTETDTLR